eukprot:9174183-Pyramimonas_sp.AAC.1
MIHWYAMLWRRGFSNVFPAGGVTSIVDALDMERFFERGRVAHARHQLRVAAFLGHPQRDGLHGLVPLQRVPAQENITDERRVPDVVRHRACKGWA